MPTSNVTTIRPNSGNPEEDSKSSVHGWMEAAGNQPWKSRANVGLSGSDCSCADSQALKPGLKEEAAARMTESATPAPAAKSALLLLARPADQAPLTGSQKVVPTWLTIPRARKTRTAPIAILKSQTPSHVRAVPPHASAVDAAAPTVSSPPHADLWSTRTSHGDHGNGDAPANQPLGAQRLVEEDQAGHNDPEDDCAPKYSSDDGQPQRSFAGNHGGEVGPPVEQEERDVDRPRSQLDDPAEHQDGDRAEQ